MPNIKNILASWELELNTDNLSRHFPVSLECTDKDHRGTTRYTRLVSMEEFLAKGNEAKICPLEDCSTFRSWVAEDLLDLAYLIGEPEDFKMRMEEFQNPVSIDFLALLKPHPEGKTFDQIRHERVVLEIQEHSETAKEVLATFADVSDFKPETDEQEFFFISEDFTKLLGAPVKLLQELYGNYGPHFYRIPAKLLKAKTFKEITDSDRYNRWPKPEGSEDRDTFLTFANFPIRFALKEEETDDASVIEALMVFAREMPLDDALNAARVI